MGETDGVTDGVEETDGVPDGVGDTDEVDEGVDDAVDDGVCVFVIDAVEVPELVSDDEGELVEDLVGVGEEDTLGDFELVEDDESVALGVGAPSDWELVCDSVCDGVSDGDALGVGVSLRLAPIERLEVGDDDPVGDDVNVTEIVADALGVGEVVTVFDAVDDGDAPIDCELVDEGSSVVLGVGAPSDPELVCDSVCDGVTDAVTDGDALELGVTL